MIEETSLSTAKPSFWTDFKKNYLGHNCTYVDYRGKVGTLKYPPSRPYSQRLCTDIRELEITRAETIDDKSTPEDDLRHFKFLSKLYLGRGVKNLTYNAIPTTVEHLSISKDLTLPKGILNATHLKQLSGPGYSINLNYLSSGKEIYLDEFGRLNIENTARYSNVFADHLDNHIKGGSKKKVFDDRRSIVRHVLKNAEKSSTSQAIYIYANSFNSDKDYSSHIIVDTYPMPEDHKTIPDEKLIGLFINSVKEFDLKDLSIYPNLLDITAGKDVETVRNIDEGTELLKPTEDGSVSIFAPIHEKKRTVTLSSEKTNTSLSSTRMGLNPDKSNVAPSKESTKAQLQDFSREPFE